MAHFYQKPDGKHISDKTIPLTIGQTIPMGLWGYKLPSDEELGVIISNPAVVSLSSWVMEAIETTASSGK